MSFININKSSWDFLHTRKKMFTCTLVICFILYYILYTFADFKITAGFSKSDMFNWLLEKFENRQKQVNRSMKCEYKNWNSLPLLATHKIPGSSEINFTSHNWMLTTINLPDQRKFLGLGLVLSKILICLGMIQHTPFLLLPSKAELCPWK